jgi:hypothetical protein
VPYLLKIRNLERIEKYSLYKITVYENEDEDVPPVNETSSQAQDRLHLRIWQKGLSLLVCVLNCKFPCILKKGIHFVKPTKQNYAVSVAVIRH